MRSAPIRLLLLDPLGAVFRDRRRPDYDRLLTTALLADYAADRPVVLADLLLDADGEQYAVLLPKLQVFPDRAAEAMSAELGRAADPGATDAEKEARPGGRPTPPSPCCTSAKPDRSGSSSGTVSRPAAAEPPDPSAPPVGSGPAAAGGAAAVSSPTSRPGGP